MGTSNFKSMEYGLPLIVGGIYSAEFIEQLKADYLDEYGDTAAERIAYDIAAEMSREAYEDAETLAENFDYDNGLEYYEIKVEGGYYEGFQFCVNGKYFDDYNEMDNEDAHYYFGKCRSQALRAAEVELRKIERWLWKICEDYGYEALCVAARFSNGETWYTKTEKPKRKRAARTEKTARVAAENIA